MNIVVIPFHDWKKCEREGFRTRDAHFMKELGTHPDVHKMLVVNRPVSIPEMIFYKRHKRIRGGSVVLKGSNWYVTKVDKKIYVLDFFILEFIKPILMHRNWIPYIFREPNFVNTVKWVINELRFNDYSAITFSPLFYPLIEKIRPSLFIFDALDNLLKHPDYKNVKGMSKYYMLSQKHADVIFTNSEENQRWLSEVNPYVTTIGNGVDTEQFNKENQYIIPDDLKRIKPPIVGYAGKMQEMVDVQLMNRIANEFPNINFVFIGQRLNPKWVKSLWRNDNVYYLGDKEYEKLPSYLKFFDICFIPYDINKQHGGDPIKFYEYIAMGKPVVTTEIGSVGEYSHFPQVRIAKSHQDFINGLRYFLNMIYKGEIIPITNLPIKCTWKDKTNRMVTTIQKINSFYEK